MSLGEFIFRCDWAEKPPGFPHLHLIMKPLRRLTVVEQTAAHIREALRERRWGAELPGVLRLAKELVVSKDSVRDALRLLEGEGVLAAGGTGRSRKPAAPATSIPEPRPLRVAILSYRPLRNENSNSQRLLLHLQQGVEAAGHVCDFAPKTQECLRHDLKRIIRMVETAKADAWVVDAGSGELLEWFARQDFPAIGLGGRRSEAPLARVAVDLSSAFQAAARRLTALGHRRIVLICPQEWRQPQPGHLVQVFLDELQAKSPAAIDYHVPAWEQTADGFHTLLESLFRVTPPTALIVIEPMQAVAVLSFLAQRGLRVPRDVSLITRARDASLEWCRPALAHFHEAEDFLVRHIVLWVAAVARGKVSGKRTVCAVGFEEGESIAPPPQ
jgi:DNA-binding LacI/PurR family transcriptional regulator